MCELWQVCLRTCLEDGNVRYSVLQASFHVDPNNTLRSDASVAQRSRQNICGVIQFPVGHLTIICTDNCNLSRKTVVDLLTSKRKGINPKGEGGEHDIITARKRSLRRLCFYLCLSVILFTGGGWSASVHAGIHPPGADHPPRSRHSPTDQTPQSRHLPMCSACWEIRATSGQYTSYWNACIYLFGNFF